MSVQDGLISKGESGSIDSSGRAPATPNWELIGVSAGCVSVYIGLARQETSRTTCEACGEYELGQTEKTIKSNETPSRHWQPWQEATADLFGLDGNNYLVTAD